MDKKQLKHYLKKIWWFIWESDSIWSWIVNIILAFILIKFIVYPGLGLMLQTTHPIVAVVSGSMEHDGSFDQWWASQAYCQTTCAQADWYSEIGITKEQFKKFPFKNGFNKGDIMILWGTPAEKLKIGDILVFQSQSKPDPIIHRIIKIEKNDNIYYFQTKGDHNIDSYEQIGETNISQDITVGYKKYEKSSKAVIRIPLLGYVKIAFVELLKLFGIMR
jgi:signal peptidase I